MVEGKYLISLKTPLGLKTGTVVFHVDGSTLTGTVEALGKVNNIQNGTVSGNNFSFNGVLQTPLGKITYEAKGIVEGDAIRAIAKTSKGTMELKGSRI